MLHLSHECVRCVEEKCFRGIVRLARPWGGDVIFSIHSFSSVCLVRCVLTIMFRTVHYFFGLSGVWCVFGTMFDVF